MLKQVHQGIGKDKHEPVKAVSSVSEEETSSPSKAALALQEVHEVPLCEGSVGIGTLDCLFSAGLVGPSRVAGVLWTLVKYTEHKKHRLKKKLTI